MYPQMSEGDNVEGNNNEEEGNEAKEDKSEDFYEYEMSRKNDEEYFLDHKVINENETEDELKVANFQSGNVETMDLVKIDAA
ncbi:2-oxoglutarate-dependent dioxygenase [Dirofilaria immitis]